MNLLQETREELRSNGYTPQDVAWVGSRNGKYVGTWEDFVRIANRRYNPGYGSNQVSLELVVVLLDGAWLERHEYDGSEWWEFKRTPEMQQQTHPITEVFVKTWEDPIGD